MFDVGGGEFLLIILAIIVLFGPKKIPEMARSIGKAVSYLRNAQSEFERNVHSISAEVDAVVDPKKSRARAGKTDAPAASEQAGAAVNETAQPETASAESSAGAAETTDTPPAESNGASDNNQIDDLNTSGQSPNGVQTPKPADGMVDRNAATSDEKDLNTAEPGASTAEVNKEISERRKPNTAQS